MNKNIGHVFIVDDIFHEDNLLCFTLDCIQKYGSLF